MMATLLALDDVVAGYGGPDVLKGVTLHVDEGEVVALLGPNGAGKSTALLTLSGLLHPRSGSACVMGENVDTRRPYRLSRRGLAHVPENRELIRSVSVDDNLKLGAAWLDRPAYDVYQHFPVLRDLGRRRAGLLSGGEQQMLTLARAMIGQPRALMIDEMSLGLAPKIVQTMLPSVRRYASETGAGVLFVEQHFELALRTADRGYVLVHGEIVIDGSSQELIRRRSEIELAYLTASRSERRGATREH